MKDEEKYNKKLMQSMWVLIISTVIFYIGILTLAFYTLKEGTLLGTIVCASTILFILVAFYALKLEIDAGYYECRKCHHRFKQENYFEALMAPHIHTIRYLRCPECNKKSFAKKVMTK